jgi:hypothetical protein
LLSFVVHHEKTARKAPMRTIRAVVIAAFLIFAFAGPAHADLTRTPQQISTAAATPTTSPTVRPIHPRKRTAGSIVASLGIGVILVLAAGGSVIRLRRRSRQ